MQQEVLFGVCADVHQTAQWDASDRMAKFVAEATERRADFIIQLGDFLSPDASGRRLLDVWERFDGPRYHVLGNHDAEHDGKEAVMAFQRRPMTTVEITHGR